MSLAIGADDVIVLGSNGMPSVHAEGGEVSPALPPEGQPAAGVNGPSFLPDGRNFLFTTMRDNHHEIRVETA